jgi:dolichyl-phosphate beta-glucosyltransferase
MAVNLSIVIPAHNESLKIRDDILAAGEFLRLRNLSGEILVVDDGSTDGTGAQARQTPVTEPTVLRVTTLPARTGKGGAVRAGVLASCGQVVACVDSGCCVPYSAAWSAIEWVKEGTCQIAIGSRKMPGSRIVRGQPWHRRACSAMVRRIVVGTFPSLRGLSDTQCGFKVYSGPVARELFGQCVIDGFLFDVEILVRAIRKGYDVRQFPVEWTCDRDSRLSSTRSFVPILAELVRLRRVLGHG